MEIKLLHGISPAIYRIDTTEPLVVSIVVFGSRNGDANSLIKLINYSIEQLFQGLTHPLTVLIEGSLFAGCLLKIRRERNSRLLFALLTSRYYKALNLIAVPPLVASLSVNLSAAVTVRFSIFKSYGLFFHCALSPSR
ncbi:hypothetical protein PSOS111911_16610 [Pseudoalteromonas ostreae]